MPSALEHKPWRDLEDALVGVHGQLGVFALADAKDNTLFIGYAGGGRLSGLKGKLPISCKPLRAPCGQELKSPPVISADIASA